MEDNRIQTTNDERKSERGVTTVEYAVMLFLIAIGVLAFGQGLKNSVTGVFTTIINGL